MVTEDWGPVLIQFPGINMNIGILSYEYPPKIFGGVGIHVSELSRHLATGNNQVHVFTSYVQGLNNQQVGNIWVHRSQGSYCQALNGHGRASDNILININVAAIVRTQFLNGGLDLLHSHGGLIQLAAATAKRSTRLPLVMTAHSVEINRTKPDWQSVLMEESVVDRVNRFIAVSKSVREELNQTFGIGYDRISVIPNGVDTEIFKHLSAEGIRRKYRLDNSFVVLFVGRDDPQKGVRHLVDAVQKLRRHIPGIMLIMVGQQDIYHDRHILCIPHVNRRELILLYSLSDVFVLPSIYEPFGIVLLEAMACEIPCIGTRVGGIPEIITHNRTGLLVEPESSAELSNAIIRLYDDPQRRYRMGKKGRERVVSYFNWPDISANTVELYQQVLQ